MHVNAMFTIKNIITTCIFFYTNVFFYEPFMLTEPCDEWLQAPHSFSL